MLRLCLLLMTGISARFADDVVDAVDLMVDWWRSGARGCSSRGSDCCSASVPSA
jgi:hypothetical protein